MPAMPDWFYWALLSALFAAMTAIFAKIGLGGINSDLATLIRTFFILFVLAAFVYFTKAWSNIFVISAKSWVFLFLSAIATGASWVCYFRALKIGDATKVAPLDKLSLVMVAIFAVIFLGERPGLYNWLGILMIAAGVILIGIKA
ncbi:EamA family transporter [Methyloradius palustris]|uniref:Transporter n=1 Tax=Methyloradius palustris TaxID=2778876 RepID=A0A8D5GEK4_9PROT|nr:EamA family transporter [Methyloradius palustris]BCM25269.1 transporter [Methyloradius palustris]